MNPPAAEGRAQDLEVVRLLLEQVYSLTGYDFRDYSLGPVRLRLLDLCRAEGFETIDALRERALAQPRALQRVVEVLAAQGAEVFRDPAFFAALRRDAAPLLRTYPTIRVWHAGCATGEETYSLAVLLRELELLPRCRIYATDLSPSAVRVAREGVYPLETLRGAAQRHAEAGGEGPLAAQYKVEGPLARFDAALRERITFSQHSLATDASFNEFQLVVTRDVIVQFNRALQERVFRLIDESLCPLGLLGLGRRNPLRATTLSGHYEPLGDSGCLFRRAR